MNRYQVKLGSIARLPVSPAGVQRPLCDSCCNKDCGNPIEFVQMSVFGLTEPTRLYKTGGSYMPVIRCEGYIPSQKKE